MRWLPIERSTRLSWIALLLSGLVVGLLITTRAGNTVRPVLASRTYPSDLNVNTVAELQTRQHALREQLKALRDRQDTLQRDLTAGQDNLEDLQSQIDSQNRIAGLSALRGPGVAITLDDSSETLPAEDVDVNRYVIHQQQLVTLVGVLWNADAEAIAINDQRITDQTSIYCVGSTVIINQELLAPPFVVRAIGDPVLLAAQVQSSPLLANLWERQQEYGIVINIKQHKQVQVPAYNGPIGSSHLEVTP